MLNDQSFWSSDAKVKSAVYDAKSSFSENIPYRMLPSSVSRGAKIIVFSTHFVECFRLMLSSGDGGCIIKMSEAEKDVYYSYVEYQDGNTPSDPDMLAVVVELDNCVVNEVECKTETYLDQALSGTFEWDTCPLSPLGATAVVPLTQEAYDAKVLAGEVIETTTYMIQLNSVTIKILLGSIVIWQI